MSNKQMAVVIAVVVGLVVAVTHEPRPPAVTYEALHADLVGLDEGELRNRLGEPAEVRCRPENAQFPEVWCYHRPGVTLYVFLRDGRCVSTGCER